MQRYVVLFHNFSGQVSLAVRAGTANISHHDQVSYVNLSKLFPATNKSPRDHLADQWVRLHPKSPARILQREAMKRGHSYSEVATKASFTIRLKASELARDLPSSAHELVHWKPEYQGLGRSLASVLALDIARDEQANPRHYKRKMEREIEGFLSVRDALGQILNQAETCDEVAIFNGRLPAYAGAAAAVLERGLTLRYFEGNNKEFLFFEAFTPHTRSAWHVIGQSLLDSHTNLDVQALTSHYLMSRRSESSSNPFASIQGRAIEARDNELNKHEKIATIFTTSPDEKIHIDDSWDSAGWDHQYSAIKAASSRLQELGFTVILRMHPNLASKSWKEFRRAYSELAGAGHVVFGPLDDVDSYSLMEFSDVIVVWQSTVGIEACALGKPVYVLGETAYEWSADVRKIANSEELRKETFSAWDVDATSVALSVIASIYEGRSEACALEISTLQEFDRVEIYRRWAYRVALPLRIFDALIDLRKSPKSLFQCALLLMPRELVAHIAAWLGGGYVGKLDSHHAKES